AQEYARTIKALWQMVEEEELSYQIDAAATAHRQREEALRKQQLQDQEQDEQLRFVKRDNKIRHNYKTFPGQGNFDDEDGVVSQICHEPCCSVGSRSFGSHGVVPSMSALEQREQSQSDPSWSRDQRTPLAQSLPASRLAASPGRQGDDEDDGEESGGDSEEDREQRRRELEELERELVILGLQRYQEPPSPPFCNESFSRQQQSQDEDGKSRRESFYEPNKHIVVAVSSPPPPQQQQQQRRQRQRQNSLAYEERCLEQDTLMRHHYNNSNKSSSPLSPTLPKLPISAANSTTKPKTAVPMLDFRTGILDGGDSDSDSSDDDDDDAAVLGVARRVSVRPHAVSSTSLHGFGLGQGRQRPSWEVEQARGRGVSWAAPARSTGTGTATVAVKASPRVARMSSANSTIIRAR
ncbi:hypothetical protein BGZ54_004120, partial [Gamsiella multidivaricata]